MATLHLDKVGSYYYKIKFLLILYKTERCKFLLFIVSALPGSQSNSVRLNY